MTVCKNPWCKATFYFTENDMMGVRVDAKTNRFVKKEEVIEKQNPQYCKKCQSFDKELSGGVSWQDKSYEGSRFDGMPHEIKYKVTNFKL